MAITHLVVKDGEAVSVPMLGGTAKMCYEGEVIDLAKTAEHFAEAAQHMTERMDRMFAVQAEDGKKVKQKAKPKQEDPPANAEEAHSRAQAAAAKLVGDKRAVPSDPEPAPVDEEVKVEEEADKADAKAKAGKAPETGVSEG